MLIYTTAFFTIEANAESFNLKYIYILASGLYVNDILYVVAACVAVNQISAS